MLLQKNKKCDLDTNTTHVAGFVCTSETYSLTNDYIFLNNHVFHNWQSSCKFCKINSTKNKNTPIHQNVKIMFQLVMESIIIPFFSLPDVYDKHFKSKKYNIYDCTISMFYDEYNCISKNGNKTIIVVIEYMYDCIVLHVNAASVVKCCKWMSNHALHLQFNGKRGLMNWHNSCSKLIHKMDMAMHNYFNLPGHC